MGSSLLAGNTVADEYTADSEPIVAEAGDTLGWFCMSEEWPKCTQSADNGERYVCRPETVNRTDLASSCILGFLDRADHDLK